MTIYYDNQEFQRCKQLETLTSFTAKKVLDIGAFLEIEIVNNKISVLNKDDMLKRLKHVKELTHNIEETLKEIIK